MGQDAVREDLLNGKAKVTLTAEELQAIDDLYVELTPKRDEPMVFTVSISVFFVMVNPVTFQYYSGISLFVFVHLNCYEVIYLLFKYSVVWKPTEL